MKKSSASLEVSPHKSVAEELERLRKTFRSLSHRYVSRIDSEIVGLKDLVTREAEPAAGEPNRAEAPTTAKPAAGTEAANPARDKASQFHDLRDMLTLLRTFEVTSGVARRKDLKRVETLVEELRILAGPWA